MATSVLVSLIVLLSFYGFHVDGKVDRYALNIVENGTIVNEEVEVDAETQTEVIRVPQHNNVAAVEIMNDFEAGLSARRIPATKDCYVSKLDSSFPSPAKMKLDMDQASRQSLPNKVTTKKTGWRVVGFADRLDLPAKILDFCGSFPIYNVEAIPLDLMNTTLIQDSSQGRWKRSHFAKNYTGCKTGDMDTLGQCLKTYKNRYHMISLECTYDLHVCFYIATCKHYKEAQFQVRFKCDKIIHHNNYRGICCTPSCP